MNFKSGEFPKILNIKILSEITIIFESMTTTLELLEKKGDLLWAAQVDPLPSAMR